MRAAEMNPVEPPHRRQASLGQTARGGEQWAARLLRPARRWIPRSLRPIGAEEVARALLQAAFEAGPGVTILPSSRMQP